MRKARYTSTTLATPIPIAMSAQLSSKSLQLSQTCWRRKLWIFLIETLVISLVSYWDQNWNQWIVIEHQCQRRNCHCWYFGFVFIHHCTDASWSQFWPPPPANASSPTHPETRAQLGAKHGAILIAQLWIDNHSAKTKNLNCKQLIEQ